MKHHFVIPAYRESERLPAYLEELCEKCESLEIDVSFRVVDDGSGEKEIQKIRPRLEELESRFSNLLPTAWIEPNRGKGGAVYEGWRRSPQCDFLGFVDADGSIPARELIRLVKTCSAHPEEARIGSRIKMLGHLVTRSNRRHYLGRVYATLVGMLFDIPVYDSQCGIKILPRAGYDMISADLEENGFAFDMEVLLLLNRAGIQIREEPIDWHDVPGSKVHLLKDSLLMVQTLLRLRKRFSSDLNS